MARILVVEDAVEDMALIEQVLRSDGHVSLTASNAETGVVLARALLPELIIMDIQLPGMDGLAAARRLKDHTQTRYIPLIALTLPLQGTEARVLAAECDGYIVKPLTAECLQREIRRQIERHKIVE